MPRPLTTRRTLVRWGLLPALAPRLPVSSHSAAAATDLPALLAQAGVAMRALKTYHFDLTYEAGKTTLWEEVEVGKAAGDVVRPDRFRATIEAKLGLLSVNVEVVGIGEEVWVAIAGVEQQIGIEEDAAAVLLDPTAILIGAIETIAEPKLAAIEERDGRRTTRVVGRFDPTKLADDAVSPFLKPAEPMPVELTIDDDGHVASLRLDGPLIRRDSPDAVRRLDLSRFDDPIEIER